MKLNVPNCISIFRILLIPAVVICYSMAFPYHNALAAAFFILAVVSDFLDGRIARKYNQITMLGQVLDPLADKLMVFSVLITLSVNQVVSAGIATFFLVIELTQLVGGLVLYIIISDVPPSNIVGKSASVIFYVSLAALMIFENMPETVKSILLGLAVALTSLAFITYTLNAYKLSKEKNQEKNK